MTEIRRYWQVMNVGHVVGHSKFCLWVCGSFLCIGARCAFRVIQWWLQFRNYFLRQWLNFSTTQSCWRSGTIGRESKMRSRGRGTVQAPLRCGLGQVNYTYVPRSPCSVIWRWCPTAGKVTSGLAENNGNLSLPLGLWLISPAGWLSTDRD